jgi:hypothetical protein
MTYIRLAAAAVFTIYVLAACNKADEDLTAIEPGAGNHLLSFVPEDTPYLAANLEPVPEDVVDTFLTRLQPVMDSMQAQLSKTRAELETYDDALPESGDLEVRLSLAVLQELDGNLSRPGLESLGFDVRSHKVIYGMGAFPVIRLGLSDPASLRATIERVLGNAGITAPEQNFQGIPFWRVSDQNLAESAAGLYLAILEDHLAISMFPPMAENELLPYFLGHEKPVASNAQARLQELNRQHGYTPHGSGILELHKLADQFMQPDAVAARALALTGEFDAATLAPECVTETHQIIDNMPRMTMGTTEMSASAIAVQYRVETPRTLAGQLMDLVSRIPMVEAHSDRILEFAFGMKFGPVRDFLREKANAIVEEPYQCTYLAELNSNAAEALAQLNQAMPPFVNNFRGIRLSLSEFMMSGQSIPENAKGQIAVHVDQPEMFVGMAQMFLPDLSELAITPGDPPVRLPASLIPVPGMVAFAAMSDSAIGLAMGEAEESGLTPFLGHENGPEGMFLSANYDMAAYLAHTASMGSQYAVANHANHGETGHHAGEAFLEIQEAAQQAFSEMADRSHSTLRFSGEGFVADNRMTFK